MKKTSQTIFTILAISIAFGCQKNTTHTSNLVFERQILSWLIKQKSETQPNKANNIDLLSENLNFSNLTTEDSHDGEKILIIPIADKYKQVKGVNKNWITTLVVRLTASGDIRNGNVVLFIPKNAAHTRIPTNTFHAIVNTGEPLCDGEFRFLSVTGKRLYALTYENKRLAKESKLVEKALGTGNTREDNCIDWFLVITIYYDDGTTFTTEEYLTTTCPQCDNETLESECPDHSGEGNPVEYEYTRRPARGFMPGIYLKEGMAGSQAFLLKARKLTGQHRMTGGRTFTSFHVFIQPQVLK
jgi:hypothetical protein